MSVVEYTMESFSISSLPLVKLGEPEFLIPLLTFTAHEAPPCVADALMGHFVIEEMRRTGCDYAAAFDYLQKLIH